MAEERRVRVLPPDVADAIAAGEVVERPASVVKELVENAVDAGARRVEVDLTEGGLTAIAVRDDGCGIHPEDLPLCVLRHATSKLRSAQELADVRTLGFRGEALSSLAAAADLEIRSRRPSAPVGSLLRVSAGQAEAPTPVGMPAGTQVTVRGLFARTPARRKFLRAPSTETAACVETVLRVALGHPQVALRLSSDGRLLVDLPRASQEDRVRDVLARRGHPGPVAVCGEVAGVAVEVFVVPPAALRPGRGLVYVVVRGRVVDDRVLARAVRAAVAPLAPAGAGPVAVVCIHPPAGAVDVNVHPQKSEVRFSDPQGVLHAVRTVLARALATEACGSVAPEDRGKAAASRAADPAGPADAPDRAGSSRSYRLPTRALAPDHDRHRGHVRRVVSGLLTGPAGGSAARGDQGPPRKRTEEPSIRYVGTLDGRIAIFFDEDALLVADLPELRGHLVASRLRTELAAGRAESQALLVPPVVALAPEDVRCLVRNDEATGRLGFAFEAFGPDAVRVRAVPAALAPCEDAQVRDAVARILAWLRLYERGRADVADGAADLGRLPVSQVSSRTALSWLRQARRQAGDGPIPGVRVLGAADLLPLLKEDP